jgi:hypothetical protein
MADVTTDTILDYLKDCVEHKVPVDAHVWLDAAQKLTMLLEDEHDKLFQFEQSVATMKATLLTQGDSVAAAKVKIEASDEYLDARRQKARIDRIIAMTRIAKIQARMKNDHMGALQ